MKVSLFLLLLVLQTAVTIAQGRYAIVIDEFMADPSPVVGLPNHEWIELKNISGLPIRLQNWRVGDASSTSGPMPAFLLQPDSLVIVCASGSVTDLSVFGNVISVSSFPSLDNEGDLIYLKAPNGNIIHALRYTSSWYGNELKKQGGWSLEMIDALLPCAGNANWKASAHSAGGTPGRINSLNGTTTDQSPPQLKRSYAKDSAAIILVFDEPVDSVSSSLLSNFSIDGGVSITGAMALSPLFTEVQLTVNPPLQTTRVYTVSANHIMDCKGNGMTRAGPVKTGLATVAAENDLVINEILFNPAPDGFDFVEVYNTGHKIIDAAGLFIANRNNSNSISSITRLITGPFYIFPGDYLLITEEEDNLLRHYLVKEPGQVLALASLPSFPDDKGSVVLLNSQGVIIDEVDYLDDWHFPLLDHAEGVSLERVDPTASSNNAGNWHSAASTAGYGTPSYKNSQYRNTASIAAAVEITPAVFSPDNDGRNDLARIQYNVVEQGYVANVIIFDRAGRPVRNLVHNAILGNAGYWNWDGLGDKHQRLPAGIYIGFTEIFNLEGKRKQFKNVLVLAGKLN